MFVEDLPELGLFGQATVAVDVMQLAWSGTEPTNHAPVITNLVLNDMVASDSVILEVDAAIEATTTASDADGDALAYVWELLLEPTEVGEGGAPEDRPPRAPVNLTVDGTAVRFTVADPGEYRLFVYALDGRGKVGTGTFRSKWNRTTSVRALMQAIRRSADVPEAVAFLW